MRQLEPGAREGFREGLRILVEPLRDLAIGRILDHRHVGIRHDRIAADRRVLDVDGLVFFRDVDGLPLPGAGRALPRFPLVVEEHVEVAVVPAGGVRRPGAFDAARDRVAPATLARGIAPAETLLRDVGRFRIRAQQTRVAVPVALADSVAAGRQRDGLLVVHRHAGEGHTDVVRGPQRIRLAVDAFGIDVDQAHLDRGERVLERFTVLALIAARREPLLLGTPVRVLLGMPDVLAAECEAEGLQTHGLVGDRARQDDEIGPADPVPVLLLDRPEQPARLVETDVVRPGTDGGETLIARAATAAAVGDAIGSCGVPGHADHEAAIVSPVGRPPRLAVRHQRVQVLLQCGDVELLQLLAIVEVGAQRVGLAVVLMEDVEVQRLGPPLDVRRADARVAAVHDRALPGIATRQRGGGSMGVGGGLLRIGHGALLILGAGCGLAASWSCWHFAQNPRTSTCASTMLPRSFTASGTRRPLNSSLSKSRTSPQRTQT